MSGERQIYARRFAPNEAYRTRVWQTLVRDFFQPFVAPGASVLDLGCGYGEFINNIAAAKRFAMDANAQAKEKLAEGVTFIEQDCAQPWPLPNGSLDVIFTSNFFEHLPNKALLEQTLGHAYQALRPGGKLIAMGPNIRYVRGAYWDFIDHHVPLSDRSMLEALELAGFSPLRVIGRFLPYTMSESNRNAPVALVAAYLRMPLVWRFFGKQFLIVVQKSA